MFYEFATGIFLVSQGNNKLFPFFFSNKVLKNVCFKHPEHTTLANENSSQDTSIISGHFND